MSNAPPPRSSAPAQPSPEIQRLIEAQQVKPVTNLDELSLLWPAEHDPDAFLAFLREERAARRAAKLRRKTA